jgi:hypothetical protein
MDLEKPTSLGRRHLSRMHFLGGSLTSRDDANFINFCVSTGLDLTNGEQKAGGSCNGIAMVCILLNVF